ncbi:hypothetical protein BKE38_07465 [Pseudoroseomonas deserti]|uniref:Uncharacterized protein n=1 Tax=Teichococcus deserti TaxID=1817963 RepID=A0A1V2H774_9PROT|nr:hypothetical protein [Pseudoroseomonas deserti]ONG55990.1 hypothetical protein BKE38_07465 [Pseudoroseomonas deserti]
MPVAAEDQIARAALAALVEAIDDLIAQGAMAPQLAPGVLHRAIAHLPPHPRGLLSRAARDIPHLQPPKGMRDSLARIAP